MTQEAYPLPKKGVGLMTIAFDLDGTLAEPTWPSPDIGHPIALAVNAARWYSKRGYEVIVFTSRPASHREAIEDWCDLNGLEFVYDVVTDKPRAALYVDDRALTFPQAFEPPKKRMRYGPFPKPRHLPLLLAEGWRWHEELDSCSAYGCRTEDL